MLKPGLLIALSFILSLQLSAQDIQIVPQPASVTPKMGSFELNSQTPIIVKSEKDQLSADFLNQYLSTYYGFKLPVRRQGNVGILIATEANGHDRDGYTLDVLSNVIRIKGYTDAGTFYGLQSLIQLLPVEKSATLSIPAVSIVDEPAYNYRGMHLDVCRHFMPLNFIKKYIDYIALHKMNYFHWHLTDDQGWRIQIKKYPKLTTVGAWRNGTIIGNFPGTGNDGIRTGGYYTQKEVKEIVDYAAKRFVTVVPEIELPGHSSAAIAAYPYLSCFPNKPTEIPKGVTWSGSKKGKQVQQAWGVFDDVYCAGKESTFKFLENVLDEVAPLFPSKYIHIGGDECPKEHWKKCPNCQARIMKLGLKNEHELQSYFVQRIEKYLNKKGKTIIGWDEILEGGLAPNAIVMSWRGEQGGITAARQKHQVIMTPNNYVYFDYQQAKMDDSVTITNNRSFVPIEKVYGWDITPADLKTDERGYIMGGQANLWTEYIKNPSKVEYMIFPKMAALSEALWTPKSNRQWNDFDKRLRTQKKRYDLWGVNYYGKQY